MGRKGSEIPPSKRYPLRSTHSSGKVLRSATNKSTTTCSEPLNDSVPAQPAVRKRNSGSSSGSPNNSVRVLRSASKIKIDQCGESLNDSIPSEPDANKRKGVRPSKVASPFNSVRVLRSASKNKDKGCSEILNGSTTGVQASNGRKLVTPSNVGSPNNSLWVLHSASENNNEAYNEPLNDNIVTQPSVRKRKSGCPRVLRSASKSKDEACSETVNGSTTDEEASNGRKRVSSSKVGSPNNSLRVLLSASKNNNEAYNEPLNDNIVTQPSAKKRKSGSPRVLRSNSKRINETFNEPLNDSTAAQPASRKRNSDTPRKGGSPKLGVRVLRSASKKMDVCVEPLNVSMPVQPVVKKRKSGRSSKERSPKKDYLKICQRVRYVLHRMNYEQSLIQAYAGEGWKGQSLEKIRPEKELERAKAEILRCKIKIREAFRNMDSLLSEGKLEESLFDSAGEIFSEDIFCAICGSKDVTLKNDIILCDGACDRGFHQNCLSPPLRTEDIPPGDEGWFCPACVCKIDCIDALNELQGSKLSVHDSWEKVFPEAASLANGSEQHDAYLPLGNSEDNNYNPALAKGRVVKVGRSSAEDDRKDNARTVDDLGLPSDDSEDDDFDPAGPDSSEDQKSKSHSEESDFTSDSDDFCAEIAKSCGQDEVSPVSNVNEEICNHAYMETEVDLDVVLPVSSRRQVERLDYKKLYDEAYGEESSSSSDDGEWSGKEKLEDSETDGSVSPAKWHSRRASVGYPNSQRTPQSELCYGSVSEQQAQGLHSNGSNGSARRFGPIINQKLKGHFEKDTYPSRATKESLAWELGLTFIQVDKWFASTRHSSRVAAAKKGKHTENHATGNNGVKPADSAQVRVPNDEVLAEVPADRNIMVREEVIVQKKLDEGNKEDILLSRAETETVAYGKESSYPSDDKEWSGTSISQKELEDSETDSLAASNRTKRLTRRAPIKLQNNEKHIPLSEQLHGAVNDQITEAPCSNRNNSKARKYHFGPIVNQKLKVHFEKDPYPSRSTVQSLAQELGLTFIQVRRWFSSSRHYSSVSAAKKGKDPGNHTNEKNDSATVNSIQGKESNNRAMENLTEDRNDTFSRKLMLQINLNEGNNDDIMFNQHPSCEGTVATTPTAISRQVGLPGYMPVENQGNSALWSTGFEHGLVTTPTTVSREVGQPGYGSGENRGYGESLNIVSKQRLLMTPTTTTMSISQEVPPGYGPGENQGNNASLNTSSKQGLIMTPSSSREACPPGYGPGEDQVNSASWNTSSEQRVDTARSTISRQVSPPGYEPRENQASCASWNTSTERRVVTTPSTNPIEVGPPGYWPGENQGSCASWNPSTERRVVTTPFTNPIEVGPPGYWPGENQGKSASWNKSCEESVFTTRTTLSEGGPPGYWPRENKGNGASTNVGSPMGRSAERLELGDEARKKAIARELRRMKKFR